MDRRDPFNLQSLPEREPPAELWQSIDRRLNAPRAGRLAALAATVVLAVGAGVIFVAGQHQQPRQDADLDQYRLASAALERRVEQLQTATVDGQTLEQLSVLENHLAWVDYLLAEHPEDPELWRHRLELLDSLASLYADQSWLAQIQSTTL